MALQVMAPQSGNVGANIRTPKLSISVPEFKNFGPAPEIVNPVGEAADGLFKTLLAYQQRKQKIRDNEDLSAAVNDLQKQTLQFQSDWKGTHFGTEARDAGKIFSKNVDDTALKMIEERFKGRPELAAAFRSRAAQISFSGFSQGTAYDDQQDMQYRKSTLEGMKSDISSTVATGSEDDIAHSIESYKAARGTFFPGMNFGDDDVKLGRAVTLGRVQRSMNEGNYDAAWSHMNDGLKSGFLTPDDVAKVRTGIENKYVTNISELYAMGRTAEGDALSAKVLKGTAPAAVEINEGIASATTNFSGKTKYGFGSRDPKSGSVDCSGWIGYMCDSVGLKGFRGKTADQLVDHAMKVGRPVSSEELLTNPRPGMIIGIDTGSKGWDAGRKNGIDHVVMTFNDPNTGILMVSESSSSKGVHATPADEWLAMYQKKGAKFFTGDISGVQVKAAGVPQVSDSTRLKVESLKMKGSAIGVANGIADQILGEGSTYLQATHEERVLAADALLAEVPENLRPQVTSRVNARLFQYKRVQDAQALDQRRQYLDYAKQQGWTPQYAADQVDAAENLNPTAKEWLKKYYEGKVNKPTPENKNAYGELLRLIDLGPENGGIDKYDDVEVASRCQAMGLTNTQAEAVKKYASEGGAAGKLKTSLFDAAYRKLHPNCTSEHVAKARGNMFDLVTQHFVDPGKNFTLDSVSRAISVLETQGEDSGRFGFGKGRDSTYWEHLKSKADGGQGDFYPDISDADQVRITERLKAMGVKDITMAKITEYYFRERGGK